MYYIYKGLFITLFASFILIGTPFNIYAINSKSDSIRKILPKLNDKDKLNAYEKLWHISYNYNDSSSELKCIYEYIKECNRQQNPEEESFARSAKLFCFYNYDMMQELIDQLPSDLKFMEEHKQWCFYYESWNVLVDQYLYKEKYLSALLELRKMYKDARARDIDYGIGIALSGIGYVYMIMQNPKESAKYYQKAIDLLKKEDRITTLLDVYSNYCDILVNLNQYNKIKDVTREWKNTLDTYKKKRYGGNDKEGSLDTRYTYCYISMSDAEMGTNNLSNAKRFLSIAQNYMGNNNQDVVKLALYANYARYYQLCKDFNKALEYNQRRINLHNKGDVGLYSSLYQRAEILMDANRPTEAASIYKNILPEMDSVNSAHIKFQFNDLCSTYEVDELKHKNENITNKLYITITVLSLMLILLILYFIYTYNLRKKNNVLFEKIAEIEREQTCFNLSTNRDNDSVLYHKICELMQEKELFKNPLLNRDNLAKELGTNRTYIGDTIKKYSNGMTTSEFINQYRLRYAGSVLAHNINKPINEVYNDAGFNSRSTYCRLFHDYFGMSPSEYRSIAKEKIKKKEK